MSVPEKILKKIFSVKSQSLRSIDLELQLPWVAWPEQAFTFRSLPTLAGNTSVIQHPFMTGRKVMEQTFWHRGIEDKIKLIFHCGLIMPQKLMRKINMHFGSNKTMATYSIFDSYVHEAAEIQFSIRNLFLVSCGALLLSVLVELN